MDEKGVARNHDCYREDELFEMVDDTSSFYDEERPDRPNFLDLIGQSGSTPVVSRKPRFQFTIAANAYELNNLDNEALDAPIYTGKIINPNENSSTSQDINQDFTSLPCETFLVACMTESDLNNSIAEQNFIHRNPMYQSVHVPYNNNIRDSLPEEVKKDGKYHYSDFIFIFFYLFFFYCRKYFISSIVAVYMRESFFFMSEIFCCMKKRKIVLPSGL